MRRIPSVGTSEAAPEPRLRRSGLSNAFANAKASTEDVTALNEDLLAAADVAQAYHRDAQVNDLLQPIIHEPRPQEGRPLAAAFSQAWVLQGAETNLVKHRVSNVGAVSAFQGDAKTQDDKSKNAEGWTEETGIRTDRNQAPEGHSGLVDNENRKTTGELQEGKGHPFSVLEEFEKWHSDPDLAMAVAAIKALTAVIRHSETTTMMGLEIELKEASDVLKARHKTSISISAGCDLFMRYVTRVNRSALDHEDLEAGKSRLIERGEIFSQISHKARQTIADLGQEFVHNSSTVLTHGFSRVVLTLLKQACAKGKHFSVVLTEGRPDGGGLKMAIELAKMNIPTTLILDAAVGYMMERVDMVLVGAEGVVESGGIMNMVGTFQVALVARALNKPVYVAAESYKFARLFPLDQRDLEAAPQPVHFSLPLPPSVTVENTQRDYTPPEFLTLLFTDLGVLTPSAVSDELIQLYL